MPPYAHILSGILSDMHSDIHPDMLSDFFRGRYCILTYSDILSYLTFDLTYILASYLACALILYLASFGIPSGICSGILLGVRVRGPSPGRWGTALFCQNTIQQLIDSANLGDEVVYCGEKVVG